MHDPDSMTINKWELSENLGKKKVEKVSYNRVANSIKNSLGKSQDDRI